MNKFVLFIIGFLIIQGTPLSETDDQYTGNKSNNPRKEWLVKDELNKIEKSLGYDNKNKKLDGILQIQNELNRIEKVLKSDDRRDGAAQIQEEHSHASLRQMDESLNSLKLNELNRIEKALGNEK